MIRPASIGVLAIPEPLSLSFVRANAANPVGTIIERTAEIAGRRPFGSWSSPIAGLVRSIYLGFFDYTILLSEIFFVIEVYVFTFPKERKLFINVNVQRPDVSNRLDTLASHSLRADLRLGLYCLPCLCPQMPRKNIR